MRLAGIGVADERDGGHGRGFAPLALLAADETHLVDLRVEVVDALADAAAVGLEFGFAGAAGADAAAELRHGLAAFDEPRHLVLKLRQLDLQLAFFGAGVRGEDVQDELRAVDDAGVEMIIQQTQLRGRKVLVEDDDPGVVRRDGGLDLFDLAHADERGGIGLGPALDHRLHNARAGGAGQLLKLFDAGLKVE